MASCASLFQDLASAHPPIREAEANLEIGRHIFQNATKQIHKLSKNSAAAQVLAQTQEILRKDPRANEGQSASSKLQVVSQSL